MVSGDEAGYAAAGYELSEIRSGVDGAELRIWKAARASAVSTDYIEVKKTTHLRGQGNAHKRAKFWMQATLAGCGGVLVAETANSYDGQTATFNRFTLDELEASIPTPSAMWSDLEQHLQAVMEGTSKSEGQWTLTLSKRKHDAVALNLKLGWTCHEHLHDTNHIAHSIAVLDNSRADAEQFERGSWEMENGRGWSTWNPDGLSFFGLPGEVHDFKVGGYDYRVVFGPEDGMGVQENLLTGRQRKLRFVPVAQSTDIESISEAKAHHDEVVQELCEMGFARLDVTRCLDAARGDPTRAVAKLLANM